jgi:hypothetical protein
MTRRLLIVLITTLAAGCSRQHRLEWPGLWASGESPLFSPGAALYTRVGFSGEDTYAPISFRLPDGTFLSSDPYHGRGTPPRGFARRFKYETGSVSAQFDETGGLIGASASTYLRRRSRVPGVRRRSRTGEYYDTFTTHEDRGGTPRDVIAVGDLYGMKMALLPATRAELVEVFGEPTRETSHIPTMAGF